jgi:microcystin-dependent protein
MANFKLLEDMSLPNKGIINYVPGDIVMINSSTVPDGWLSCDGQSVSVSDYSELYSAIGTYYGSVGSPVTSFTVPDLNNQTSTFNKYITGTVGNASTWTAPTYPFHTHASDTGYQVDAVGVAIPIHNHTYSRDSTSGTQPHNHAQVTATTNSGWAAISTDTAGYDSAGSAGGISDSNHTHPFTNFANTGASNLAHTHTATATVGINAEGSTHTHIANETVSFDSASHAYPVSFALRFVIKL